MSVVAELTAPGAPFELGWEDVAGERMQVFARRAPHLRALLAASARFGDAEYLVFDDARFSYRAHLQAVAQVAAALEARFGVRKGDRVALWAANCPEWILTFWAAVSLGALPVAMNGWWAGEEARWALEDAQPKVLIADEKRLARLREPGVPVVSPIISIEHDFARLRQNDAGGLPSVPLAEDDPAAILYTSGTTGRPKGVLHTHRNVIALVGLQLFHGLRMLRQAGAEPPATPRCTLVTNPLFHVSGLYTQVVTSLTTGARTVWTRGRFEPLRVLELIERERITGWSPHGAMGPRVVDHPAASRFDLSSVVNLGSGGAPVPASLQARLRQVFPNARPYLTVGYGMTECTALACITFGDELERWPTTVGRPLPTVEVELRDERGRAIAPGPDDEPGEVHVRSPLVMREYWRSPEATAETIRPGRWLKTGDLGRLEDGRLFLDARKRELILRGAENISPVEIERRLEAHPEVREAAVIGVDHPELGQEVKAIIVPRGERAPEAEALRAWVGEALAAFKVPRHVEIRREPLPRNAAGKVLRSELKQASDRPFAEE